MVTPTHEGLTARAHGAGETVLFDAVLTPHRSLSRRGFRLLMAGAGVVSLAVSAGFFLIGAWPVVGFFGVDLLLLYAAFRANFRAARLYETVTLTRQALTVARVSPRGDAQRWRFQPAWLRVFMADPPEHDSPLTLRGQGRDLYIGSFLTAAERLELAHALQSALNRARMPVGTG